VIKMKITPRDVWEQCPDKLIVNEEFRPADIWLCGGILWRGWVEEQDIDLAISGIDRRPEVIQMLENILNLKFSVSYDQTKPYSCGALLYSRGIKVSEVPICPSHKKLTKERIWELEKKQTDHENRIKTLEQAAVIPP
jgi:predicted nucleotidyltransferase